MEEYKSFKLNKSDTSSQLVKIDEYNTFSSDLIKGIVFGVYLLNCSVKDNLFSVTFYDKNNNEIKDNFKFEKSDKEGLLLPVFLRSFVTKDAEYGKFDKELLEKSVTVVEYIDDEKDDFKYWYLLDLSRPEKYLFTKFKTFDYVRGIVTIFELVKKDVMMLSPTLPFSVNNKLKIYYEFQNKGTKFLNSYGNKFIESIPFERNLGYCTQKDVRVRP